MLTVLCLLCFMLLFASYIGYPLVLAALTTSVPDNEPLIDTEADEQWPSLELVIAAYNEENVIREKLENSLQLDYPRHKLTIRVASDGSDDNTDLIVQQHADSGIALTRVDGRLGKTHCQNIVVAASTADIIVFSDANTIYKLDALKHLAAGFRNPAVGCVIGNRRYIANSSADSLEGVYERFENWLKERESRLGGTIGACGAIYAVRRSRYRPLPAECISDIIEPLRVACDGHTVVYSGQAVGEEPLEVTFWRELSRKRRIVLRTLNSLWAERRLLVRSPRVCVKLIFHKIIRWQTLPLLVLIALTGLWAGSWVAFLLGLGAALYLVAALGLLGWSYRTRARENTTPFGKPGRLLLYSIGVFSSAFVATLGFLRGKNQVVWESRS